jgi:hypothetical protein
MAMEDGRESAVSRALLATQLVKSRSPILFVPHRSVKLTI